MIWRDKHTKNPVKQPNYQDLFYLFFFFTLACYMQAVGAER